MEIRRTVLSSRGYGIKQGQIGTPFVVHRSMTAITYLSFGIFYFLSPNGWFVMGRGKKDKEEGKDRNAVCYDSTLTSSRRTISSYMPSILASRRALPASWRYSLWKARYSDEGIGLCGTSAPVTMSRATSSNAVLFFDDDDRLRGRMCRSRPLGFLRMPLGRGDGGELNSACIADCSAWSGHWSVRGWL